MDSTGKIQCDTLTYAYNEWGRVSKMDHGSAASMEYSCDNLHGWLTDIQSAGVFEQTLSDVSASETQTSVTASSISSNATSLVLAQNNYGEKISYDRNSNILTLQRRGMLDTKKYGLIDDLEISYNGNQRTAVTDNAGSLSYDNASDFVDGVDKTEEYSYDANGALVKDLNRGIDSIEYDLLGNPKRISFSNDKSIEYVYSADGVKLRETHISPILNLGSTSRAFATVGKKTHYRRRSSIISVISSSRTVIPNLSSLMAATSPSMPTPSPASTITSRTIWATTAW